MGTVPQGIVAANHEERERMRAVLRGIAILVAAATWLAPATTLAQEAPTASTNTPPSDAVGPRELQNFSLSGNVTKPADQPAPPPTATSSAPKLAPTRLSASIPSAVRHATRFSGLSGQTAAAPMALPHRTAPEPAQTDSSPGPDLSVPAQATPSASSQPNFAAPSLPPTPTVGVAPAQGFSMLPWLLAALVLAAGTAFLVWLRRPRESFAGPQFDLFTAPEPEPAPVSAREPVPAAPAPPAPKPKAPAASSIVASRLRPSLELGVQPLRCVVEDSQVIIEFEIELFNSGTAPARAVLAEASLLNAGATQDKELISFFANPIGAGERLDSIPPMRRMNFASRVVAPRASVQEYEVAGRKAFVPVIAFNALYEWSGGKAQTSAAYLVGRETKGEKLGPLHLDLGPRAFTSLGARALPATVRT